MAVSELALGILDVGWQCPQPLTPSVPPDFSQHSMWS